MASNVYEVVGRERKAQAIAGALWQAADPADRRDTGLARRVARFTQEQREVAAAVAGVATPSWKTWARVSAIIGERHRQEVAHPGFPRPCPRCDEDGVVLFQVCGHSSPCPCDLGEADCPACDGRGYVLCSDCGEHVATSPGTDGDPVCEACATADVARSAR